MRTLELRLEDWRASEEVEGRLMFHRLAGEPIPSLDYLHLRAALEFFDRALPMPLTDGCSARACFEKAAALTLLRFGVRIVGLEEEVESPVVIRPEQDEEFAP